MAKQYASWWPLFVPVAAIAACIDKWFFDAPTWTAALDAGLVTAFVLLVVLHLMKGAR